jgi:hypothetical protein
MIAQLQMALKQPLPQPGQPEPKAPVAGAPGVDKRGQ